MLFHVFPKKFKNRDNKNRKLQKTSFSSFLSINERRMFDELMIELTKDIRLKFFSCKQKMRHVFAFHVSNVYLVGH